MPDVGDPSQDTRVERLTADKQSVNAWLLEQDLGTDHAHAATVDDRNDSGLRGRPDQPGEDRSMDAPDPVRGGRPGASADCPDRLVSDDDVRAATDASLMPASTPHPLGQ